MLRKLPQKVGKTWLMSAFGLAAPMLFQVACFWKRLSPVSFSCRLARTTPPMLSLHHVLEDPKLVLHRALRFCSGWCSAEPNTPTSSELQCSGFEQPSRWNDTHGVNCLKCVRKDSYREDVNRQRVPHTVLDPNSSATTKVCIAWTAMAWENVQEGSFIEVRLTTN